MFPIRITTLMTEEVYKRFSWAILVRRKGFVLYIIILIIGLFTYVMFSPLEKKDNIYHVAPPICALYVLFWHELSDKESLSKKSFISEHGGHSDI